ncbi:hypothetical protein EJB05_16028, partial [Eragrostis curvula]
MDLLCDTIMVEEILPRMHPISILRLGAASRRYNALVRDPDFAAGYWQRAGIFFQRSSWPAARPPLFLTGDDDDEEEEDDWPEPATEYMFGEDLGFLPGPSAAEKAYLRSVGSADNAGNVVNIMHSAAGLLLCSRGITLPMHFYVCNPVTCQWVALPELPWIPHQWRSGLLTVDTDEDAATASSNLKRFQVVLFNHPMHWLKPGGCIDLKLFSSDTGQWKVMQLQPPIRIEEPPYSWSPILVQSGTAYWIMLKAKDRAVAYNSVNHSVRFVGLPRRLADAKMNRIIGERHGGGLRYAHANSLVFEVWDLQTKSDGNIRWKLVHRVGVTDILEWNPEAVGFLVESSIIKPVGFHPTDDDVVFLGMPGAVAAYSIEYGTMSIQCTHHSSVSYEYPNVVIFHKLQSIVVVHGVFSRDIDMNGPPIPV